MAPKTAISTLLLALVSCSQEDLAENELATGSEEDAPLSESMRDDTLDGAANLGYAPLTCGSTSEGLDSDGDGYARTGAGHEKAAIGCFFQNNAEITFGEVHHPDCNDFDPELFQVVFRDYDRDGYGDPDEPACVGANIPEGYSTNFSDCDDYDARVHTPEFQDEDGDGFRTAKVRTCLFRDVPHFDWASQNPGARNDCNDEDPDVNPDSPDFPGDSIDSDCDLHDGTTLFLEAVHAPPTAQNPQCADSPDLHFSTVIGESACPDPDFGSRWYVTVNNRGGVRSEGATLIYQVEEEEYRFPLRSIEPNEETRGAALGRLPVGGDFRFEDPSASENCSWETYQGHRPPYCPLVIR